MTPIDNLRRSAGGTPVVVLRGVSKLYPTAGAPPVPAVRNVSLEIRQGEVLCLMGSSGSGKSTLLRHVNGLIAPSAGTVEVLGQDLSRLSERQLRSWRVGRVAMVFQQFGLLPHRTVRDNVALPLELRGMPEPQRHAVAETMLARVHLGGWGDRYPDELSGGMQQRVGLARALAAEPSILLMDEPFSALDPDIRGDLQRQFLELAKDGGITTLLVTHDPTEALRLGDRIAVMRGGELVQVGPPEDLLDHPADPWVARLFDDLRRPAGAAPHHPRPAVQTPDVSPPPPPHPTPGHLLPAVLWGPPALAAARRWGAFWLALAGEGAAVGGLVAALVAGRPGLAGLWAAVLLVLRATVGWAAARPACRRFRPAVPATTLMLLAYGLIAGRGLAGETADGMLWHFPASHDVSIAASGAIDLAIDWLQDHLAAAFAGFTTAVRSVIEAIEGGLGWLPWPLPAAALIFAAWRAAGLGTALFAASGLAYLGLFGFWDQAAATIALVGAAVLLCVAGGLPLGILLAKQPAARRLVAPALDVMQTLPPFVYLIPAVAFFSVGKTPAVIATVIFALPPMIRLTALGLAEVPAAAVEAAQAYGASPWQSLIKVELPLAINALLLGINQTIMMSLSMVVVAALIGAGGLGHEVTSALRNVQGGAGLLAGLAIVLCALVPDRIIQGAAKRRNPRS